MHATDAISITKACHQILSICKLKAILANANVYYILIFQYDKHKSTSK